MCRKVILLSSLTLPTATYRAFCDCQQTGTEYDSWVITLTSTLGEMEAGNTSDIPSNARLSVALCNGPRCPCSTT